MRILPLTVLSFAMMVPAIVLAQTTTTYHGPNGPVTIVTPAPGTNNNNGGSNNTTQTIGFDPKVKRDANGAPIADAPEGGGSNDDNMQDMRNDQSGLRSDSSLNGGGAPTNVHVPGKK